LLSLLHTAAATLREFPARWRFRRELQHRTLTLPEALTLSFGEPAASLEGLVHGGRVKLLQLAKTFPRDERNFNLLYLVSSAIPPHAEDLVTWARRHGAKFVWNQNGVGFPAWAGARTRAVNRPMARLRAQADFIVYQSDFCRISAERYLGPASAPFEVLVNPVDLDSFSPAPRPPPLETIQLLAAGTHNQSFRVLGGLETLRRLRAAGHDAHLTIAGKLGWPGGTADVSLAIVTAGLTDHVTHLPAFSQGEAVDLLRASHILLHLKYHDPCPTMVIEALACGVPVVGSRSGGLPELIGPNAGALLEVPLSWRRAAYPKPAVIVKAVETIVASWPQFHEAARARAERMFSANAWVEAHRRIFERVLQAEVAPRPSADIPG
jgi:glycosyltransferase involved in cell wall biosynthesis